MAESRTIGVFGAGWVGLVTGGCFAELGHDVIVRDVVPERIAALQAEKLPFHEPELPELLKRNSARLHYSLDAEDLAKADVIFIASKRRRPIREMQTSRLSGLRSTTFRRAKAGRSSS